MSASVVFGVEDVGVVCRALGAVVGPVRVVVVCLVDFYECEIALSTLRRLARRAGRKAASSPAAADTAR